MTFANKLRQRFYRATMRYEAMGWVRFRSALVSKMIGRKDAVLNIFPDVHLEGLEGLVIGDNVSINRGCNISAGGGLTIGNHVSIGHGVTIVTADHGYDDPVVPIQHQPMREAPVRIGSNVWVGAQAIILSGVEIADGTVIAAGAVVTQSVTEADTIIGGVPARRLKGRFD